MAKLFLQQYRTSSWSNFFNMRTLEGRTASTDRARERQREGERIYKLKHCTKSLSDYRWHYFILVLCLDLYCWNIKLQAPSCRTWNIYQHCRYFFIADFFTHFHLYCNFIVPPQFKNNMKITIKLLHVLATLDHPQAALHLLKLIQCISSYVKIF
jgi:hypothetical protein